MIIFINGSINAGKSTVAKILSQKMGNCALLEIDALREMIDWMPLEQAIPINLENAVSLIKNYDKNGLNVIVPYPISEKNYIYMTESLKSISNPIFFFTLSPKLEKALTNRGERELDDWEIERIKHHYNIGLPTPAFGEIIDNSEQNPEETVNLILSKING